MRLTRFRLVTTMFLLVAAAIVTAGLMLRHEPAFYRRVSVPAGPQRFETSYHFVAKTLFTFFNDFVDGSGSWSATFTQDQLNSFFEEDFDRFGDAQDLRDLGITNPRLEFDENRIRLGFRYGNDTWSTVLSYDLKVWLVPGEVNVLAIEIERRRAGSLPIPTQHVFQELRDIGRRNNIDIEWYRHNGNPVAIVKFQTDRARPTAQLRRLEIAAGKLELQGVSFDPGRNQPEEQIKKAAVQVSQAP